MRSFTESRLSINEMEIAIKVYTSKEGAPSVLALHGWLDNAATFDVIAPLLDTVQLISFDLPGHGLSSHRAAGADYYIWSYVNDVMAVADALNLEQFSLLGHSMGGAVACLVSSLYPERVVSLALLDALGPTTTAAVDSPAQMRKALKQKLGLKRRVVSYYESFDAAIEARARKGVSLASAALLGKRGIAKNEEGYYWSNDQRLATLSLLSLTDAHVEAFLKEITCPALLVASSRSWNEREARYQQRLANLRDGSDFKIHLLDGNHHQHLEGQVEQVAALLRQFFI